VQQLSFVSFIEEKKLCSIKHTLPLAENSYSTNNSYPFCFTVFITNTEIKLHVRMAVHL